MFVDKATRIRFCQYHANVIPSSPVIPLGLQHFLLKAKAGKPIKKRIMIQNLYAVIERWEWHQNQEFYATNRGVLCCNRVEYLINILHIKKICLTIALDNRIVSSFRLYSRNRFSGCYYLIAEALLLNQEVVLSCKIFIIIRVLKSILQDRVYNTTIFASHKKSISLTNVFRLYLASSKQIVHIATLTLCFHFTYPTNRQNFYIQMVTGGTCLWSMKFLIFS